MSARLSFISVTPAGTWRWTNIRVEKSPFENIVTMCFRCIRIACKFSASLGLIDRDFNRSSVRRKTEMMHSLVVRKSGLPRHRVSQRRPDDSGRFRQFAGVRSLTGSLQHDEYQRLTAFQCQALRSTTIILLATVSTVQTLLGKVIEAGAASATCRSSTRSILLRLYHAPMYVCHEKLPSVPQRLPFPYAFLSTECGAQVGQAAPRYVGDWSQSAFLASSWNWTPGSASGGITDQAQDHHSPGNVSLDAGNAHVREVVRQAHEELRRLLHEHAELVKRIGTVKRTITGLANIFGDSVLTSELLELVGRKNDRRQPGFTKTCRVILMESVRPLTAQGICDEIQQRMPLMLVRHKDPASSVTTVLNRLVAYGEAQALTLENGRRAWQWVSE